MFSLLVDRKEKKVELHSTGGENQDKSGNTMAEQPRKNESNTGLTPQAMPCAVQDSAGKEQKQFPGCFIESNQESKNPLSDVAHKQSFCFFLKLCGFICEVDIVLYIL